MAIPQPPPGPSTLAAVTDAMVTMHRRYHHREPCTAKTLMLGSDLLACVMGGVYTDVEKTLIEMQHRTVVQETRSHFQEAMRDRFIATVQQITGRRVLAFISNTHVGPDLQIELFMLESRDVEAPPLD